MNRDVGRKTAGAGKVLHVLGEMLRGGAEMRLMEIIERLPPGEFQVDICALSGRVGPLDGRVAARGGSVIPMPLDKWFPGRFLRLLRDGDYRVVHSHVCHASGPILALAMAARIPVRVAHFHSMDDGKPSTMSRRLQRRVKCALLDFCATDIIACGEGSMDAVWSLGWRDDPRCRVIYDAIDPERFDQAVDRRAVKAELGIPPDATLFVHVGNDAWEKNHSRLLRIFAAIRELAPKAWLLLAGSGTDRADGPIARDIAELGIRSHVVALGARDDVPRLMKAADALLLPSHREGLPGVVLEACVAGIPVLATDLPGVREIAVRLPGVSYLPLTAADAEWARVAMGLPAAAARLRLSDLAADCFQPSVFHVDRAVEAHRALWRHVADES